MKELTDLEICKRIADIEDKYKDLLDKQVSYNSRLVHVQEKADITRWFNPLKDDALCFQLMIKHDISFWQSKGRLCAKQRNPEMSVIRNENPNKAICLAIIKAHDET